MQNTGIITDAQLLQPGKERPLLKFEIYDGVCWVDLTDLGGKNYVKNISVSSAGAEMTPRPVAGKWSATILNKNGMFDPDEDEHAPYNEYLRIGRRVKISIGSRFNGVDYYWRRIYGFMELPNFSIDDFEVSVNGMDNMQFLTDTKLRMPDNYWGSDVIKLTIASEETLGAEMYDEDDAMEIIADANNVDPWDVLYEAVIADVAPGGAPSTNVGRVIKDAGGGINFGYVEDNDVGTVEQGKKYKVVFQYLVSQAAIDEFAVGIYKTATTWQATTGYVIGDTVEPTIPNTNNCFYVCTVAGNTAGAEPAWPIVENGGIVDGTVTWATQYMDRKKMGEITGLTAAIWTEESFYFIATESCAIKMRFTVTGAGLDATEADIDVISIKEVTGSSNAGYNLPDECNGPYYVTLDGDPIYYRNEGQGWYYESETKRIFIEDGRVLVDDQDLRVYYFTTQIPENVVADLLVNSGLYDTQAEALAGMIFTPTTIEIDQVWFKKGTTAIDAVKMLCERCNYRFHFNYAQRPVFDPAPAAGATVLTFNESQISKIRDYEDRSEIRNRIVIEGQAEAQPIGPVETMPSELKGVASGVASINKYGEHTWTITNHLFQDQATIDAYLAIYLAAFKEPKWYAEFETPLNPAPLEKGDTVEWRKQYEETGTPIDQKGIIRNIQIRNYTVTYKLEKVT